MQAFIDCIIYFFFLVWFLNSRKSKISAGVGVLREVAQIGFKPLDWYNHSLNHAWLGLLDVWCCEYPPPTLWCLLLSDMDDDDRPYDAVPCCTATILLGSSTFVMNLDVQSALAPFEVRMLPCNI